ncbi:MAG: tRNA pseudouridine(55) synthase TruB [Clostridiales bacterium]|nr:tRNA pseudouridine(55) synthase TruB [Candidatus Apopatousia equi]
MNGIIVVNKPLNYSSNKITVIIKKLFNEKKVGHLGTLDPQASGVLPVCLGKATRLFDYYLNKTKTYVAEFTFGKSTDTLDTEGKVIETSTNIPTKEVIKENLKNLLGEIEQLPPNYSAKKVNGKKAYELARQNIDFELKPKKVVITKFELLKQIDDTTFEFLIDCSSGTYIRSLARDLGKLCNSCGFMSKLVRTRCGNFTIENSVELDKISQKDVISIEKVLENLEKYEVLTENYEKLKNGVKILVKENDKQNILIYCKNELFGIGEIKSGVVKINTYLHD